MLFMIIEHFTNAPAVYARLAEGGRLAPAGLTSWECEDRSLLEDWMRNWADLVRFEVVPIIASAEAAVVQRDDHTGASA
ncbi:hypothetical protein P152DRAFT_470753 [Eremomyces bilateralis CBS 781.70]|uniref:DUF3303 domain-containing protein n=1 Tax=Eremomyces bilateralis CBS 781.70 TaxID=1392243 RepID=A0A6G1GB84_9PEZI|nr:uncharacterized protein P152DRAFT_470753 [Eremomyces bilateralis CBS 781.70]KAF1815303.1 hypothetical protein P152DRAFT_470753 [Eremomyces bilateralis CBS 781.70]